MPPDDHVHEVGDDTTRCTNCILDQLGGEMSAFELATWNWHCKNVSQFTINAGLLPAIILGYKFADHVRELFTTMLNMIDLAANSVAHARARKMVKERE